MPSKSYYNFRDYLKDVENLISTHMLLNNKTKGKKGLGHLTRSGIMLLCSALDNYVEDILIESLEIIVTNRNFNVSYLPKSIKKSLSEIVKIRHIELKSMLLTGEISKTELRENIRIEMKLFYNQEIEMINHLFKRFLAIENISGNWIISNNDLNKFFKKSNEIMQNGLKAKYIKIEELIKSKLLIMELVQEIDFLLLDYIIFLNPHDKSPWRKVYI